jgi:hypothetical protein
MSTLHQTINALASEFAHSLVRALRNASLDEIIAETHAGHSAGGGARRRGRAPAASAGGGGGTARRGGGRLQRRSQTDINGVVTKIVALLKGHKKGLRAEEIREKLHLDRREIPRPLAEALKKKLVSKKGKKRATTYFA